MYTLHTHNTLTAYTDRVYYSYLFEGEGERSNAE